MPRGVYDRSKSKAQRATEKKAAAPSKTKTASAAKGTRKYTKRTQVSNPGHASFTGDKAVVLMATARENLAVLAAIGNTFGSLPSVKAEIEAHVLVLSNLREQVFGTGETESEPEVKTATSTANGTTAQSVPLPPAPTAIPVPPAPVQS